MTDQQQNIKQGVGSNGRRDVKPYRDTEWYKKRREDVPAINPGSPVENPFKRLFQNGLSIQAAGNPTDKTGSSQLENGD